MPNLSYGGRSFGDPTPLTLHVLGQSLHEYAAGLHRVRAEVLVDEPQEIIEVSIEKSTFLFRGIRGLQEFRSTR